MRHVRTAWSTVAPAALSALFAIGCGRTPKVDNPVLGPPPPRISMDDRQSFGGESFVNDPLNPTIAGVEPGGTVRMVAARANDDGDNGLPDPSPASRVVARVNGEPILEGDVLQPYVTMLEATRHERTDRQNEDLKLQLVSRDLVSSPDRMGHIDRLLLVQALRSSLKAEQFTSIEKRLDELFESEVAPDLRKKAGVSTNLELGRFLEKEGQSLDSIRRSFVNQQLAQVYVSQNTKKEFEIGRGDLVAHYDGHRDEYEIKPRVRWQRLQVKFTEHGGKQGAFAVLEKAVAELRAKRPFEEVIRDHSDGSHASNGGAWDWTGRGELKDERIENALFNLPIGSLSQVYADDESYQIVRVVERIDGGHVPFEKVQEEVELAVKKRLRERESERVLGDLKARAEITSVLDGKSTGPATTLPFR